MFAALLDTCVLWPSLRRDFLLSLAVESMYRPLWSSAVLEELEYHEAKKLLERRVVADPVAAAERAAHLIVQMRRAFADAEVSGWEPLVGTYGLPDEGDEHVVAAAVVGGAGVIVTLNAKHFPRDRVPLTLDVVSPSQFARDTVSLDPARACRAVSEIAQRSGRRGPKLTVDEIFDLLVGRYGMDEAVELMREVPPPLQTDAVHGAPG